MTSARRTKTPPSKNRPPAHPVDVYAQAVVGGQVPAGKYHRLSCERHLRDRAREASAAFPYRFDVAKAEKAFRFFSLLRHYKGKQFSGKPITLEPWQQFVIGSVFGWVHVETSRRRFEGAFVMIPRKNGKSLMAAGVAMKVTFFDGEAAGEGYIAANKRDQARIVFGDAQELVRRNPPLKARLKENKSAIWSPASSSKLVPLGRDSDTQDGLNWNLCVIDEFHAMKDRGLLDVLESATGARDEPLMFQITTAGKDPLGPCGEQYDYVCKILDNVWSDDRVFTFIAHADADDDPYAEATWLKANPNLGISIDIDKMRTLAHKAKQMPSALAEFQQKRLNIWVNSSTPWLNIDKWRAGQSKWTAESLERRRCWGGLDLSSKTDLAAFVLVFPPEDDDRKWRLLAWFFTPEEGVEDREKRLRAPLKRWIDASEHYVLTNPGSRIDHRTIADTIAQANDRFEIQQIGFDPWNIGNLDHTLKDELEWDETRVIEIPQTITQLSEPCKEFEALVGEALVDAGDHPVMLWMASNVVVIKDSKENIFPTKNPKKTRGRIDGIVAGIMGLKLAQMDEGGESVYESRGLLTI